ncbi:MAG: isoprenylcysteine carboxylmethyltransferase family protein [Pelolinea sp.]|nr:isoprenylcysteine carboxylmethyltransferase family protein [Pelolinea sp.]
MADQGKNEVDSKEKSVIDWKVVAGRFVFTTALMGGLLFLSAGRWNWWEGWVYLIYTAGNLIISRVVLIYKFPETAQERMDAGKKENVKKWDKYLVPIVAVSMPMAAWLIAGLDVRFGWSPALPDSVQIAAFVVSAAGSLFSTWAMFANPFFSSHVRIQTDRGHTVTRSGPYQFVRHPGYAGGIICWIGAAVFFGSYWMAIPVFLTIIALIVRTALEDRTLQEELPGYREYTQEVRYRLFPGIW